MARYFSTKSSSRRRDSSCSPEVSKVSRKRSLKATSKANYVRVVINGESWGVYVNQQQFNKDFTREFFGSSQGERWHVPGSPGGRGSLAYLGDEAAKYKGIYEIKSKDEPAAWNALINLCKVLNETPPDQIEKALGPLLDIDGALRFLALENALINTDGYWIRTSSGRRSDPWRRGTRRSLPRTSKSIRASYFRPRHFPKVWPANPRRKDPLDQAATSA